jgi:glutamine cyclotransferase
MTTDGSWLILSDGTPSIYYLDPVTFRLVKTLHVTNKGNAIDNLNELEFIRGAIYANRYMQNYIVRIDTANGKILAKLDLSSLDMADRLKYPGSLEMNGIAYDSVQDKIYVTGKLWRLIAG